MAQDINDNASGYWFNVDSLDAGESLIYRVFHGNIFQKIDNGVLLNGYSDPYTIPDSATIDLGGETQATFEIIFDTDSLTGRNETLWEKEGASNDGPSLLFVNNGGNLDFRARINNSNCDFTIPAIGRQHFRIEYLAAAGIDVSIFRNGSSVATCDTDEATILTNSTPVNIGNLLTDTTIHYIKIADNTASVGEYSFDGNDIVETDDTSPTYAGTFLDSTSNNNDGTYSFSEDQTGILVVVNPPIINTNLSGFPVIVVDNDRFEGIFTPGQIVVQPTPNASLMQIVFSNTDTFSTAASINVDGPRFAIAFAFGLVLMIPAVVFTRFIPLGLVLFISPVALGAASGWYNPIWALIMVLALPIAWWGSTKALETSVS